MSELKVTIPRRSSIIFLLISVTGLILALFTDPLFMAEQSFNDFSAGRWCVVGGTFLCMLWCVKGSIVPQELFRCNQLGVYIPGYKGAIDWNRVVSIEKTEIQIGSTSNRQKGSTPLMNSAIQIRFDDAVKLEKKFIKGNYARVTSSSTFIFSIELTGKKVEDVMGIIDEIRGR
jgi:hypothetical protein